jgi:hypothetical protein
MFGDSAEARVKKEGRESHEAVVFLVRGGLTPRGDDAGPRESRNINARRGNPDAPERADG